MADIVRVAYVYVISERENVFVTFLSAITRICVQGRARAQCGPDEVARLTLRPNDRDAPILIRGRAGGRTCHRLTPRHRSLSAGRFDETDAT